jgi:hypothetical protein
MSIFGLIEENMELSHIHLTVLRREQIKIPYLLENLLLIPLNKLP